MQLNKVLKKDFLPVCENDLGITHLQIYAFYIRDTGYQLEVWPVKVVTQTGEDGEKQTSIFVVPGKVGKCITLVPATTNDFVDEINRAKAEELLPAAEESLVKEILDRYGLRVDTANVCVRSLR